jgi:hypothetical protein
MGISGDDAGCPARNYMQGDNGRLNLPAVEHSDSRSAFLGIKSQFDPTERERIRTHQVSVRRAAVAKIWDRGVPRGELDPNLDPEMALDLIFGPAMYRRATGHGGLTPADADAIVATAMRALAS